MRTANSIYFPRSASGAALALILLGLILFSSFGCTAPSYSATDRVEAHRKMLEQVYARRITRPSGFDGGLNLNIGAIDLPPGPYR